MQQYIIRVVFVVLFLCPVLCVEDYPTLSTPTFPSTITSTVETSHAHFTASSTTPQTQHQQAPVEVTIPVASTPKKTRVSKPAKPPTLACRHLVCEYGRYGDQRAIFTNNDNRKTHEQLGSHHPCTGCFICSQVKLADGFTKEDLGDFKCNHTSCRSRLKNKNSLLSHMKLAHEPERCGVNCAGCGRLQHNKTKKTTRETQKTTCSPCASSPPAAKNLPTSFYTGVQNLAAQLEQKIPLVSPAVRRSIKHNKTNTDDYYIVHIPASGPCSAISLTDLKDDLTSPFPIAGPSNTSPIPIPSEQMLDDVKSKDQCTLRDIRWNSLLQGHRGPPKSSTEENRRLMEAKALLPHIFNLPYEECLQHLLGDKTVANNLIAILPESVIAGIRFPDHTVDALLQFKDTLTITDANWPYVVEFMHLGPHATLHYLRQKKKELNNKLEPRKTAGNRGHELDICKMIQYLLEKAPPKDPSKPVRIKFALDGATITSSKRTQLELATLQILTDHTLKEVKSHTNAHQWMVYLGQEDYETLKEELANATPQIKKLLDEKKIQVGDIEYTLELFLTCDMKCVTRILGLYEVYHPKSKFKCPWCEVDSCQLHDFTIKKWAFRCINKMKQLGNSLGNASVHTRAEFAGKNFGVKYAPLLPFPLQQVVPCMLHATSGLAKLLLRHLCKEGDSNAPLAEAFRREFTAMGVKLVPVETENKKIRTISEQLKASRIQRPQYLAIIENHSRLIDVYKQHSVRSTEYKYAVGVLWHQFYYLLARACQEEVTMTEDEWLDKARIFGGNFTLLYCNEDVTPYLHVFVYHVGYYLEKYGAIELFGNYAIECRVRYDKRVVATCTNGFSVITAKENVTFQILMKSWRDDVHLLDGNAATTTHSKKRKRDDWAKNTIKNVCSQTFEFVTVQVPNQMAQDIAAGRQAPSIPPLAENFVTLPSEQNTSNLHKHTVAQLKEMLKALELPVSGVKQDLINRLVAHTARSVNHS